MNTYTITVKHFNQRGFAPPAWYMELSELDTDAELVQLDDDDNGNIVYEVASAADLTLVRKVRGVVSVEQT
jgi:hypothetical protein